MAAGAAARSPVPPDDVVYFVLVDRFANGDAANDVGVDVEDPAAWHGGDLIGLRQRLDWLESLGVRTVWISPVYRSRTAKLGEHGAFHGYWVEDHLEVDRRFGGRRALAALSRELHRRGMRLLLDVVVNHVGYDAPLTRSRPEWFHGRGDITDWNDPVQLTTHDVHGLPDLAVERTDVARYLTDHARKLARRADADGFRLDAVKHVPLDFWARFNDAMRADLGPEFFLLGEDLEGRVDRLARTAREGRFDSVFDFPLHWALVDVACDRQPPGAIATVLSLDRLHPAPDRLVTLLDNHDLPRIASRCRGDDARIAAGLELLFSLRGIPSLMYGTEVGMSGAEEPANRASMRFDDAHPRRAHIAALIGRRQTHAALHSGLTRVAHLDRERLALVRLSDRDAAVVAYNGSGEPWAVGPAVLAAHVGLQLETAETLRVPAFGVSVASLGLGASAARAGHARWLETGSLGRGGTETTVRLEATGLPPLEGAVPRLVGAGPELGDWDPASAPAFTFRDGKWSLELRLPRWTVTAHKLVLTADEAVRWEARENRYLSLGSQAPAGTLPLVWSMP